ncbi:hypothetical protein QYM36_016333 [Artemia franciscana]|uniref:Uncharacterized protein n=1 Tax=Artemia franciscana TaxID=6661 RepID=A0AA88HFW3_ARTSF|nr:hypothetical protein QYM36_016333 [Artemia franciscana]KAK2706254.1 hypothetical protein QYM36_016333 [Artemia franciscana]
MADTKEMESKKIEGSLTSIQSTMSKLLEFYEITCDGAEEKATIEEIKELMEVGAADFETLKDKEMMLAEKIKSTFLLLDKTAPLDSKSN